MSYAMNFHIGNGHSYIIISGSSWYYMMTISGMHYKFIYMVFRRTNFLSCYLLEGTNKRNMARKGESKYHTIDIACGIRLTLLDEYNVWDYTSGDKTTQVWIFKGGLGLCIKTIILNKFFYTNWSLMIGNQ